MENGRLEREKRLVNTIKELRTKLEPYQSDAVGFLEWSAKNDWNYSCLDDLWYNVNSDKYPEGITASELYNKFKEEQKLWNLS